MTRSRLHQVAAELAQPATDPARMLRWAHGELRGSWPQILQFEACGELDPTSGEPLAISRTVTFPDGKVLSKAFENDKAPGVIRGHGVDLCDWLIIHLGLKDALDEWIEWYRIGRGEAEAPADPPAETRAGRKTLTKGEVERLLLDRFIAGRVFESYAALARELSRRGDKTTTATTVAKVIANNPQLKLWAGAELTPDVTESQGRRLIAAAADDYPNRDRPGFTAWSATLSPKDRADLAKTSEKPHRNFRQLSTNGHIMAPNEQLDLARPSSIAAITSLA